MISPRGSEGTISGMADKPKGLLERIRGHAEWEGIKWGWTLIVPAAYAVYQKVRHFYLDWFVIVVLLCVGLAMSLFGYFVSTRKKQENQADPSVDGVLAGLSHQEKQQDETHWKKLYLEESQQRSKLQNDYAVAVNKTLQLERVLSTRPELPLTPLQIEALQLASDLHHFGRKFNFVPLPYEDDDPAGWIVRSSRHDKEVSEQLGHAYVAEGFAERVTTLVHKLGAIKMNVEELEQFEKWVGSEDNVKGAIKALWTLAEEMER